MKHMRAVVSESVKSARLIISCIRLKISCIRLKIICSSGVARI